MEIHTAITVISVIVAALVILLARCTLPVGTQSLLWGVHQFAIHPLFMAISWTKHYGFPRDVRLWIAFFVHDLGYWGKHDMDGPEGETHVELGARIMHILFDDCEHYGPFCPLRRGRNGQKRIYWRFTGDNVKWYEFCLYHSRFYAKRDQMPINKLCVCDKQVILSTPAWLYLPLAFMSGEVHEYMERSRPDQKYGKERVYTPDPRLWRRRMVEYVEIWIRNNKESAK